MRWPHLLLAVLILMPTTAFAAGPVVSGGFLGTQVPEGVDGFRGMSGGTYKLAFEVGQRFRSEWSFNQTALVGSDDIGSRTLSLSGFGYQLAFHMRPKGFSPYVGLGVEMGVAIMEMNRYSEYWASTQDGPYLRAHAVVGLRYQMSCGLGFRGELAAATYGQFLTLQHNLGISYTY